MMAESEKSTSGRPAPLPGPWPRGMGAPAARAFEAAGYTRIEDLHGASEAALLALHGVGPKAIRIVREALEARGLALRP